MGGMPKKNRVARALYAASSSNADMRYLSGLAVPDPFLAVIVDGRSAAIVNRLEYGRVAQRSRFDRVLSLETEREAAAQALGLGARSIGPAELTAHYARRGSWSGVVVPRDFPAAPTLRLQELGVGVSAGDEPFFPERVRKTEAEAAAIREGNAASAAGIRAAERVLRASEIRGKRLYYRGRVLRAETLRRIIDTACLEKGAMPEGTIVACGRQACDPHEAGRGPLRPNELIIVDVFPRVQQTGYHGDMTRTFLKGRASDAQRALVNAVAEAQRAAWDALKTGVKGGTVHETADRVFRERGCGTRRRAGGFEGFIHATGHGLGLEVHEPPRLGPGAGKLRKGAVVTVEPGLYYPSIGGCRIEDVARVTGEGTEKLSRAPYRWEIR